MLTAESRFPELFTETHQCCWTLCEHVTRGKRLLISKCTRWELCFSFLLDRQTPPTSSLLCCTLPEDLCSGFASYKSLFNFKNTVKAASAQSRLPARRVFSCTLQHLHETESFGTSVRRSFHPDQIKRGRGDWSSSVGPVAAADYLEFGNNQPLKSVTVCVCVCVCVWALSIQFNQTSWTRISQLIKQTWIKSQLYLICSADEGVELCGVLWCFSVGTVWPYWVSRSYT